MGKACVFDRNMDFSSVNQIETVIKHFSENNNNSLNIENFRNLLLDLLTDSNGKSYELSELKLKQFFSTLDRNKDGVIDKSEFMSVSNDLIQPLLKPVTALLVIDIQNDFVDGSLAMKNCPANQDGNDIIPVVNDLLDKYQFDVVVYSCDYHPENHISFFDNVHLYKLSEKNKQSEKISPFDTVIFEGPPEMTQKLWPVHCVQNSWGSKLHKDLKIVKDALTIFKGTNPSIDSYSAFFDNMKLSKTVLDEELRNRNVTHVFICGVAFDYCVSYTALDAVDLGYATVVIQDASRGTEDNNIKNMEANLKSSNCVLADSHEIGSLLNGKDIRVEFASALLLTLKETKN